MIDTGINFICNALDLTGNLKIQYCFTGLSGQYIESHPFANRIFSGEITNTGNFYDISGSGFFNGSNLIKITNASGLESNNFTFIISYEQTGSNNGILFSNYSSGDIISGFILGINDTNVPYIEYYTNFGPQVLLSNNNWSSKNTIIIDKNTNSINLSYYNFNKKELETELFNVDDNYFLWSNNITLGGATGFPSFFSGNNFKGYIDNFIFWSPGLFSNEIPIVISGIFSNVINPSITTIPITGLTLTGYSTGSGLVGTGVTGYYNSIYGYVTGACDNVETIYINTPLSGEIYSVDIIPLYETGITYVYTINPGSLQENTSYSSSFGMDGISYLKNSDSDDLSEIYYYPNLTNIGNINNTLSFDRSLNKLTLPNNYILDNLNLYINSIGQLGSGFSVTGSYYNKSVFYSGMFFITGNYISGDIQDTDSNILDIISGDRLFNTGDIFISGGATGISGWALPNNIFFLDGVKLISGADYVFDTNNLIFNNDKVTDVSTPVLWTAPIDTTSYISGIFNHTGLSSKFARGTTQLFMNGLRESINNDYVEISKYSLLNNNSNYITDYPIVFNNTNDFTESL